VRAPVNGRTFRRRVAVSLDHPGGWLLFVVLRESRSVSAALLVGPGVRNASVRLVRPLAKCKLTERAAIGVLWLR